MKKIWFLGMVFVFLWACTGLPSSTPTLSPEVPLRTPTFPPTHTPVIASPTALPTGTAVQSRPLTAIIARSAPKSFYLLGGTENGEWLFAETVVPHLSGGETYQLYDANGPSGLIEGKEPLPDQICPLYWVATDSGFQDGLTVGLTSSWEAVPRLAGEISPDITTYVEALKSWLVDKNIPDPEVDISQIFRVDLEGDGTDEVLINASHFSEPTGHNVAVGDYSLVLMRKVTGNSVTTIPIVADYYLQDVELEFPLTYKRLLTADLNNDGVLEVVVGVERWEGSGVMVFEIDGVNVYPVFEVLCGL